MGTILDMLRARLERYAAFLHQEADWAKSTDDRNHFRVAAARLQEAADHLHLVERNVVEVPPCPSRDECPVLP